MRAVKSSLAHDRVVHLIKESISLLCKTSLAYNFELNVEGLLGITLDKQDIFLVNIKESFKIAGESEQSAEEDSNHSSQRTKKRRRHRNKRNDCKRWSEAEDESSTSEHDNHTYQDRNERAPVDNSYSSLPTHDQAFQGLSEKLSGSVESDSMNASLDNVVIKREDCNSDGGTFITGDRKLKRPRLEPCGGATGTSSSTTTPRERHALRSPPTSAQPGSSSDKLFWQGLHLRVKGTGNTDSSEVDDVEDHSWDRLPRKRSRCKWHSRSLRKRVDTVQGCLQCDTHLCSPDCHFAFHQTQVVVADFAESAEGAGVCCLPVQEPS